jgi:hypothetical protein
MNKKGDGDSTISNVLGVVLAVAATLILIGFIYVAITQITRDTELEAADSIAGTIETKINALADGQSVNATIQGSKALSESWYILGWSKSDASKPDKCFFSKSCICICRGRTAETCQEKGICKEFEKKILSTKYFYIESDDYIDPMSGGTVLGPGQLNESRAISLSSNLMVLEIQKTTEEIKIEHYTPEYLNHIK